MPAIHPTRTRASRLAPATLVTALATSGCYADHLAFEVEGGRGSAGSGGETGADPTDLPSDGGTNSGNGLIDPCTIESKVYDAVADTYVRYDPAVQPCMTWNGMDTVNRNCDEVNFGDYGWGPTWLGPADRAGLLVRWDLGPDVANGRQVVDASMAVAITSLSQSIPPTVLEARQMDTAWVEGGDGVDDEPNLWGATYGCANLESTGCTTPWAGGDAFAARGGSIGSMIYGGDFDAYATFQVNMEDIQGWVDGTAAPSVMFAPTASSSSAQIWMYAREYSTFPPTRLFITYCD